MSIATTSDVESACPMCTPLVAAAACVALADWLFYGWPIGISLALFFAVLGVAAVVGNGVHAARHTQRAMTAVFAAGLLALVENVNLLAATWTGLATSGFVVVMTARDDASWRRQLLDAATTPVRGPFQLAGDVFAALQRIKRQMPQWLTTSSLVAWIIPLCAFAVFLILFAAANPLIENQLRQIDLWILFNVLDPRRMVFWVVVVCAIWPLILRRAGKPWTPEFRVAVASDPSELDHLLGAQAMSRSLILFNALFALQTVLDLTYLWGGASLPDGVSHAQYAHRGAYPLIVTALLAAGFVLIAMRPGGPAEQSRLIRPLVLAWVGQNILLVISAMFRLDIYVASYSLTYLRLAAFIWMVLVAAGLLLILIQIKLSKPNSWLLAANAVTLAAVLYGCCFINAPRLVASYNVAHSREITGTGPNLDLNYLGSLGPQALPPLEAHIKEVPGIVAISMDHRISSDGRSAVAGNWRSWGFRTWRLQRYFATNPPKWLNLSGNGGGKSDRGPFHSRS